ncbi:MAG: tetratricopeptide repeat protein, partial [Actinobacteria bacterium]|nr:tetratricopeptide repeat protein [Actinomycetota bacterium]
MGAHKLLVIASDVPEVLNLPWELLRPPDREFLGFDPLVGIRRVPWVDPPPADFGGSLRPRPLRVLILACAPDDAPTLDYEREEEALLEILGTGPDVAFEVGDLGTFEELRDRVDSFRPHIVHLTGHGSIKPDGQGYFEFEDERGEGDPHSARELRDILSGSGVQAVFVSGCQTGKAPPVEALGGICQGLVSAEVPFAMGWAASIADPIATEFARGLYRALADGQPIDRALLRGRQAIRAMCVARGDPSWTLPVLYAATTQTQVADPDSLRPPEPLPRRSTVQQPLPGMTEGYAEHFVGRRRALQRLLPALREGRWQTVLLTGIGGAGKSALATRIVRKLEAQGFTPLPLPSAEKRPLSSGQVLERCGDAFLAAGLADAHAVVRNVQLSEDDRLRYAVTVLNRSRFVLVLDNFEVNLDTITRRVLDPTLAVFYRHLLTDLAGGSRAVVTCRYAPAELPELPGTVREDPLDDFPYADFLKYLLRDPVVERRYAHGQLPPELLRKLHRLLGGTPRFLEQVRQALRAMTAEELRAELQTVTFPTSADASQLGDLRDKYSEGIFAARLYGSLTSEARRALSRAAAYPIAVPMAGLVAVTGVPPDLLPAIARAWQDCALAYAAAPREGTARWTVYGILRTWLLAAERLSAEERCAAHRAAGNYLSQLVDDDRVADVGLAALQVDLEARAQYLAAGALEQAQRVTNRISAFLIRRGTYGDVERLNGELLEAEQRPEPMTWIARAHMQQANYDEAREWYRRALAAAGDLNRREVGIALQGLASIDLGQGDYAAARAGFQQTLAIHQQIGDRAGEAASRHQLATIDVEQGDYAAARPVFQQALAIHQQIGDRSGEAATRANLASIDVEQGDYAAARAGFQQALALHQQIGDR